MTAKAKVYKEITGHYKSMKKKYKLEKNKIFNIITKIS